MPEIILSVNAGSSSVKISVFQSPQTLTTSSIANPSQLAEASIEGLTAPPARLKYERGDKKVKGQEIEGIVTQEDAFKFIIDYLMKDEGLPQLEKKEDIRYTAHRVVHGGDYKKSQIIDDDTYHYIEELSDLAPLHNAPALNIVKSTSATLPHATNIAYFDSSFHSTMPPPIHTYPINPTIALKNKLRKYGFHGISYAFILSAVSAYLSKPPSETNLIALHLGSGASVCCIRNGASYDTSMGLTPLAGLPGATRSGSIDPSLMFHFTHSAGAMSREASGSMRITEAEQILNKDSGWKALTGTTDFGAISASEREEDVLAFEIFADRVLNYVGSYFVKLEGRVDALVFAGGIGERGVKLRRRVVEGVGCLGFGVDKERNERPGMETVVDVSGEGARYRTLICRTDEQLQMARGVLEERDRFEKGKTAE